MINGKYSNHLQEIHDKLSVIDDFLNDCECDQLISFVNSRPHLNDRSKFMPNPGITGEIGKYNSIGITKERYSDIYQRFFADKLINGIPPSEIQLNYYDKGHYIPPHVDGGLSFYTVCVPLQSSDTDKLVFGDPSVYYDNDVEEHDKSISFFDKKGRGIRFDGTKPIHWVPKTEKPRYSAVILYGGI